MEYLCLCILQTSAMTNDIFGPKVNIIFLELAKSLLSVELEIIKLASPIPLSSQLLVASQFQYLLCLVLRLFIDLVKFELFAVLGEL